MGEEEREERWWRVECALNDEEVEGGRLGLMLGYEKEEEAHALER